MKLPRGIVLINISDMIEIKTPITALIFIRVSNLILRA